MKNRTLQNQRTPAVTAFLLGAGFLICHPFTLDINDFLAHYAGNSTDTSYLADTWGDTLSVSVDFYSIHQAMTPQILNNAHGLNGASGANPVVSYSGDSTFKLAYVSWEIRHTPKDSGYTPPHANIIMRRLIAGQDSFYLLPEGDLIAQNEIPVNSGAYFEGDYSVRPPPSYLNFTSTGEHYAAYWRTLQPFGPLRRTSDNDKQGKSMPNEYGVFIPQTNPEILPSHFGSLGMAAKPGSNSDQIFLIYDYSSEPAYARIRFEDLARGLSSHSIFSRPVSHMRDFEAAVDSSGNVFVMWREDSSLMGAVFNLSRRLILSPIRLTQDEIDVESHPYHTYRQYGAAVLADSTYLFVYGKSSRIFYRIARVNSSYPLEAEIPLTPEGKDCHFPDVAVSEQFVVITWYGNTHGGNRQVEGAWFQRSADTLYAALREDFYTPGNTAFDVGDGWKPWHNYRVPVAAIGSSGDVVVTYDDGFDAKVMAWKCQPTFYQSAFFISDSIRIRNPATSYLVNPSLDSIAITAVKAVPNSGINIQLAVSKTGRFDGADNAFFNVENNGTLSSPVLGQFSYLRFKVLLTSQIFNKQKSPKLDSLQFGFNIRPHPAVVESLKIGIRGKWEPFDTSVMNTVITRVDSLHLIATAFDPDNDGELSFSVMDSAVVEPKSVAGKNGFYRCVLYLPPKNKSHREFPLSISVEDIHGWKSMSPAITINYENSEPKPTVNIDRKEWHSSDKRERVTILPGKFIEIPARDTAFLITGFTDANDSTHRLTFKAGNKTWMDTVAWPGKEYITPFFPGKATDSLEHTVLVKDPDTTVQFTFFVRYKNLTPKLNAHYIRHKGIDTTEVYLPAEGEWDTLPIANDALFPLHINDTAWIWMTFSDTLDTLLDLRVTRDSSIILDSTVNIQNEIIIPLRSDSQSNASRLSIRLADPDTAEVYDFTLVHNQTPRLDSLLARSSSASVGRYLYSSGKSDLNVVLSDTTCIQLYASFAEPDSSQAATVEWRLLNRPKNCVKNSFECFTLDTVLTGDSIRYLFHDSLENIIIKITDIYGAFIRDTIHIRFPYIDTSETANGFRSALQRLISDSALVLDAPNSIRRDTISIVNNGTSPVEIDSIYTRFDNSKWLAYELKWRNEMGQHRTFRVNSKTHLNSLIQPVSVGPGMALNILFYFKTEALRGDSAIQDTLFLTTNDAQMPLFKAPFQLRFIDLPTVSISLDTVSSFFRLSKRTADSNSDGNGENSKKNDENSAEIKSGRQKMNLLFIFSEPVLDSTINNESILVYSFLDSAKNGFTKPIPSAFEGGFLRIFHRDDKGRTIKTLVDTVVFTPEYKEPGDSLKIRPLPGSFIPGDIVRTAIVNTITDSAGNPLDLRLSKISSPPGSEDSVFSMKIDKTALQVVSTQPDTNSSNFNPQDEIIIRFNRSLVTEYTHPLRGTILSVDTVNTIAGSNRTVTVSSAFHGEFSLRYFRLADNGTAFVLQTTPLLFGGDTVKVKIKASVGDGLGLTLDGNGDGFGQFWFDGDPQGADDYILTFVTRSEAFYIFPNPFKWSDPNHVEKGAMTFKNLNALRNARAGAVLDFRIHTIGGDLVYSSKEKGQSYRLQTNRSPAWDWDLCNNAGNRVATGVYLFSIYIKGKGLVKKGRLAVIH